MNSGHNGGVNGATTPLNSNSTSNPVSPNSDTSCPSNTNNASSNSLNTSSGSTKTNNTNTIVDSQINHGGSNGSISNSPSKDIHQNKLHPLANDNGKLMNGIGKNINSLHGLSQSSVSCNISSIPTSPKWTMSNSSLSTMSSPHHLNNNHLNSHTAKAALMAMHSAGTVIGSSCLAASGFLMSGHPGSHHLPHTNHHPGYSPAINSSDMKPNISSQIF